MRALFACLLAASVAGCGCYVSPDIQACTGFDGSGFACFDRHASLRLSQATEPDPALYEPDSTIPEPKPKRAARTAKPSSAHADDATRHADDAEKSITTAAKVEPPAWVQRLQTSDPVITKAKAAVAAKLDDPGSAVFDEMSRAVRRNTLGQSVDTICGRVKSKKASGESTEDRPFLYLVKDDEAFVVDGASASTAAIAYHAICN
ncbi:MAG TPA: hypothetical protein VKR55_29680 [Bradyrhizobium sp.]|uniref:hypothetical protein n=1 Tax=Bradyrhizobium sp. TaxID=376 RepID=UPI002BEE9FBC|nr:hypothetical protein [Bradyrhizobium sp.]HLZ06310.1 hypothetical protein [Bradyrhizobium sp.]